MRHFYFAVEVAGWLLLWMHKELGNELTDGRGDPDLISGRCYARLSEQVVTEEQRILLFPPYNPVNHLVWS